MTADVNKVNCCENELFNSARHDSSKMEMKASVENAGYTFKPLPHTVSDRNPLDCLATRGTVEFCFTYQPALQVPES